MRFSSITAAAAALALSGCFVSEAPLLDAKSGRAAPLADGAYDVCGLEDGAYDDCQRMEVLRGADGLYAMTIVEDGEAEVTEMRFRRIARGAWLAQAHGAEEEGGYTYFYADEIAGDLSLVMMMCEELSASLREKYVARGELEVNASGDTCTASALAPAVAAAKEYRKADGPSKEERLVFLPASDPVE